MKKFIYCIGIIGIILLIGCGKNTEKTVLEITLTTYMETEPATESELILETEPTISFEQESTVYPAPEKVTKLTPEEINKANETLCNVMLGNQDFNLIKSKTIYDKSEIIDSVATNNGVKYNLLKYDREYDVANRQLDEPIKWQKFATIDLNNDNVNEIWVEGGQNHLLLFYFDSEVYSVPVGIREVSSIMDNGFTIEQGGTGITYARWIPDNGHMYKLLAASITYGYDGTNSAPTYTINDTQVTESKYDNYLSTILTKDTHKIQWYDFTEENFAKYIPRLNK